MLSAGCRGDMQISNSVRQAELLSQLPATSSLSFCLGGEEDWREKIKQQIDDELDRRVRDALETPPLERLRRRQLQTRAKA